MENNIVKEFQKLHVFTNCNFVKMDQLVQDLTTALEETSKSPKGHGGELLLHASLRRYPKKRRERKRRSHIRDGITRSEGSESSLDEALRDYMESVVQHSDSDDMLMAHHIAHLTMPLSGNFVPQVESDSVNENISPMRPQRRRRKYKNMAIDSDPTLSHSISPSNSSNFNRKQKLKSRLPRLDGGFLVPGKTAPVANIHVAESNSEETVPGKRKRMKTKLEYNAVGIGNPSQTAGEDGMDVTWYSQESSSVSSSESDGIVTNDEAREADDEQSDYFYETDPACGVSGIIPWWENENVITPEMETEEQLQQIISGSFEHIPRSSQMAFKERISKLMGTSPREVRFGRRRLKGKMANYTVSRYVQDRQKWKSIQGKYSSWQSGNGCSSSDIKRPRKAPQLPETRGRVGDEGSPIPESNIGNRMLQNMGWSPGMGLGPEGTGMKNPVIPFIRPKRQGLGCDQSTSDS